MTQIEEKLREKDRVVLHHIEEGRDDVQKITEVTTLKNYEVRYSFEKLDELGVVDVKKPEGVVERVIDGQKRVFRHPNQAELTDKGIRCLELPEQEDLVEYGDLSHRDLVEQVRDLQNQLKKLEQKFEIFKKQVIQKIGE